MKREVEKKDNCKVLDLSIGSPTFPPHKQYIEKLKEYIGHDSSHLYPGYGAIPQLRDALKQWYIHRFNVALEDTELYPLLGAKDGVSHIPLALLDAGDEILVPDPGYPAFSGPTTMVGAIPTYYSLPSKETTLITELSKVATDKTKAVWVNSPGNPTGYTCTLSELRELIHFAKQHNIIVLYDNAYSEITFDGCTAPSIFSIEGAKDCAVEFGSFSKTFSFAGFRMAWIVGNREVIDAVAKVKSQMDSGFMYPFQLFGAYALTHFDEEWHARMIQFYKTNRDLLVQAFIATGHNVSVPSGALYLWIPIPPSFINGFEYTKYLLTRQHVLVTPGSIFGPSGERFIRVSYSTDLSKLSDYFPFKSV